MDGLFDLAKMLFGINVEPADGVAPVMFLCPNFFVLPFVHKLSVWR